VKKLGKEDWKLIMVAESGRRCGYKLKKSEVKSLAVPTATTKKWEKLSGGYRYFMAMKLSAMPWKAF
jgi:hypothetical protein